MSRVSNEGAIFAADWKRERLHRIKELFSPELKVQTIEDPQKIVPTLAKLVQALLILPLHWSPSELALPIERCMGFQIIEATMRSGSPPVVILFGNALGHISLPDYCRPFLKGVIAFLDENDPSFLTGLKKKVSNYIKQYTQRRTGGGEIVFERLGLVGRSIALQDVRVFAGNAARLSDVPVLITGESGTGKELVARAIYQLDQKRSKGPFIAVNCSAISSTLAESEFFGHKRGAFTGALTDRLGYFQAADRGVLFLDEISELDLKVQPKLLRVIQEGQNIPVGEERERCLDIRLIAATNKDLESQIALGQFRMDLYQRLNVLTLTVPTIATRKEDIEELVWFFVRKYRACYKEEINEIDHRAIQVLSSINYKGNIRELENLIRKILFRKKTEGSIEIADIPPELLPQSRNHTFSIEENALNRCLFSRLEAGRSLPEILTECEALLLKRAFQESGGCRSKMTKLLKITPRTLFNKLRRHRL